MVAKKSESSGSGQPEPEQEGLAAEGPAEGSERAAGGPGGPGGATRPMLDLDFVRGLIEAVDGSGIDSLEITRAGTRVKISKTPPSAGAAPTYFAAPQAAPMPASSGPPAQPAAGGGGAGSAAGGGGGGEGAAAAADAEAAAAAAEAAKLAEVTSPMVGTFYRAPAPEAPPYVEVGTRVSKGQTLCILEAMKLMNELESEVDGVVKEILVENAEPVEYGQALFRIDPNG